MGGGAWLGPRGVVAHLSLSSCSLRLRVGELLLRSMLPHLCLVGGLPRAPPLREQLPKGLSPPPCLHTAAAEKVYAQITSGSV